MTVSGAEKVVEAAGHSSGHKEKVEKRRALGRGLESLLPGPRVVSPAVAAPSAGAQQVPHRGVAPVRNDNVVGDLQGVVEEAGSAAQAASVIQAPPFAQDAKDGAPSVSSSTLRTSLSGPDSASVHDASSALPGSPLLATDARSGAPLASASMTGAENPSELRSDGQPGAAVPTYSSPAADDTISLSAMAEGRIPSNIVVHIALTAIEKNPYQTRIYFEPDSLEDLADSIKQSGVVQPVVVRPAEKEGRYILVLGERRYRASKMAGKETIPAIVRRVSDQQAAELTIVENLQREDLNCLEQAEAFRVLSRDFNLTQAEIAQKVGVARESVSNYMRLLKLPHSVQEYLAAGGLGFSEAMVLLQMENEEKLESLAAKAVELCWNVEQIRDAVMRMDGYLDPKPGLDPNPKPKGGARWVDPNVRAAQNDLQRLLGMRVRIRDKKGKGRIVIEYATVDDYERVVGMLKRQ
jgi:ParB family transcriptional regulator, chromosome partitioning protein